MYAIKITRWEHVEPWRPNPEILRGAASTLREFAEKVWGWYVDSDKYIVAGNRLYDADTVYAYEDGTEGVVIPSGAIYYIDLDKPEDNYCLKDGIAYEAIEEKEYAVRWEEGHIQTWEATVTAMDDADAEERVQEGDGEFHMLDDNLSKAGIINIQVKLKSEVENG